MDSLSNQSVRVDPVRRPWVSVTLSWLFVNWIA
jgi:hypothetical protein